MVTLVGQRLTLREFRPSDFDAVHAFASDPAVVRLMTWGPNTESDTAAFLAETRLTRAREPRATYQLAVVLSSTAALVGSCELALDDADGPSAHLGYVFDQRHWGHGYATEAARLLVDFGFGVLGLRRIAATCAPANLASARVLEKAGMVQEAYLHEDIIVRGHARDSLLYAITRA